MEAVWLLYSSFPLVVRLAQVREFYGGPDCDVCMDGWMDGWIDGWMDG